MGTLFYHYISQGSHYPISHHLCLYSIHLTHQSSSHSSVIIYVSTLFISLISHHLCLYSIHLTHQSSSMSLLYSSHSSVIISLISHHLTHQSSSHIAHRTSQISHLTSHIA